LITSADPIYIVELVERRGPTVAVTTRDGRRVELESELLHPLASGPDVERYAFKPLRSLLLFPYRRDAGGTMRLLEQAEMEQFPLTWAYLQSAEAVLRVRERGKMDVERWWAFGRT